jgi:hypothetical protein
MSNRGGRIVSFSLRTGTRRGAQRRHTLLNLREPLLQGIDPADQLRGFRLGRALHCTHAHIGDDRQHRHTNHPKDGNQYERRGA